MMQFIMVPAVLGICVWGVYSIIELFARKKERLLLIEKIGRASNASDKPIDINIGDSGKFVAIKFGCLLAGLGFGLLIAFILGSTFDQTGLYVDGGRSHDQLSMLYTSCALLFGGIGLIISFIIEKKYWNK